MSFLMACSCHCSRARGPAPHGLRHVNLLVHKFLIVLVYSPELKGICQLRFALLHAGDDVGAANPMSLREIGLRPVRRMIGMGMIKTNDVLASLTPFTLYSYQLARI